MIQDRVADGGGHVTPALSAAIADIGDAAGHDPLLGLHDIDKAHRHGDHRLRTKARPDFLLQGQQGCRRVADGKLDAFDNINVEYCGESVHYVFIKNVENGANDEQLRLNLLYNELELCGLSDARRSVHRIQRPRHISSYHAEAAGIVRGVLGI